MAGKVSDPLSVFFLNLHSKITFAPIGFYCLSQDNRKQLARERRQANHFTYNWKNEDRAAHKS